MKGHLLSFMEHLSADNSLSASSKECYERDIRLYLEFLASKEVHTLEETEKRHLQIYLLHLKQQGRAAATLARTAVSLRSFYRDLIRRGVIRDDPSSDMGKHRQQRSTPSVLTPEQVERLLLAPDDSTVLGSRDKAMLELLYASGGRVSELLTLPLNNVQLSMGFVRIVDTAYKERVVPIGPAAIQALQHYLSDSRPKLAANDPSTGSLFLSQRGRPMTRQGFWKLIKAYAIKADIEDRLTPHTIRHSFAVHMLDNGADARAVQEMLGHADLNSLQMYAELTRDARMKEVYDRAHPRSRMNNP